jgi:hypothetical protein
MANLIFSILSEYNGKGLAKGKKDLTAFEKQTKQLGKTLAKYLGAAALVSFGKKAVMAFAADEKAAKSLELQLKNTGFAFAAPSVEYYIANLQKTTGVLDDELRPALQKLLTVTGSITQSQDALSTALNLSAAGYGSVEEISTILAKAYAGQTTALGRLGTGLSKATLKTGNMEKIMAELNDKFAGQAAARLETYAGKMDLLEAAAANAKETIGKGLIDALFLLSKDNSIQSAIDDMDLFATSIADASYGMAALLKKLDKFTGLDKVKTSTLLTIAFPIPALLAKYGATERNKPKSNFTYGLGPSATKDIERANKILKERNKLAQDELNKIKAKTAVDALKDKFDLERIGLTAALNSATDEETKLRLRSQLAILDNNEALAKKYLAEMNAAQAVNKLATDAARAGTMLVDGAAAAFARLALYNPVSAMAAGQGGGFTNAMSNVPAAGVSTFVGTPFGQQGGNTGPVNVTLELAPNAGEFGQLIYNSFLINQRDGKSQLYNGGIKGG